MPGRRGVSRLRLSMAAASGPLLRGPFFFVKCRHFLLTLAIKSDKVLFVHTRCLGALADASGSRAVNI